VVLFYFYTQVQKFERATSHGIPKERKPPLARGENADIADVYADIRRYFYPRLSTPYPRLSAILSQTRDRKDRL